MEKEFVPYEQALVLKELGFDEPCFGYFDNQRKEIDTISSDVCERLCKHDTHIKAPTFSQAFRWFREKYNLDSFVKHLYKSTIKVGYYFGVDEYKGVEFYMDFDDYYKTYEEAELNCLKKLIEISESK